MVPGDRRVMYNPLWPTPTPTQYRIGRLNNQPEIRPRLTYGYDRRKVRPSEVRPRLDWHDPSPFAHVRPRSPFKGKMKIPRKTKFRPRSPFKGLRVNKGGKKWIQKAGLKKGALRDQLKRLGKLKGDGKIPEKVLRWATRQGGKLAQRARLALVLRGKKVKKNQYSKRYYGPKSLSRSYSRKSSRRYYPSYGQTGGLPVTSSGLVKIYDKAEQIFATGSVNAGTHGIKYSDKFTHKFTTKPSIFGVPRTGKYTLPAGAIVIKGAKRLFRTFGSKELSRRSLR